MLKKKIAAMIKANVLTKKQVQMQNRAAILKQLNQTQTQSKY